MTTHSLKQSQTNVILGIAALVLCGIAAWWMMSSSSHHTEAVGPAATDKSEAASAPADSSEGSQNIEFPPDRWETASIEVAPAEVLPFRQIFELTGKVEINDDRRAHIYPIVDGVAEEVNIHLGDRVKKGDVLAIVQSKEAGQAKLKLFQDRLERDFVTTRDGWTQEIVTNTRNLIELIRNDAPLEEIKQQLQGKPIGEYRDKLLSAYINKYTLEKTVERLSPLTQDGAISGKQMIEAKAQLDAARFTLQSLLEQIQHETVQESLRSTHSVKELDTRVSVDEAALKILGLNDEDLKNVEPASQGEAVSHVPVLAPFDGTVISKDVVLMERVGPDTQIVSLADLSTVWVTADIYEDHMPLLNELDGRTIQLRSSVWPDQKFEAKVFYTGDIVDQSTRTISLRAIADNSKRMLKPGMFINVLLEMGEENEQTLQVPLTAIQEHEGRTFVFVYLGDGQFAIRDVTRGRQNAQNVEILSGLKPGEEVVVNGGFALKSRMLASLLEE
ncbi:efflux RND transporter periplasmic adaptor subunit [Bremerella cremea]|uniref:Efflux RND transporter periplasmic adaptor subunit n=1 Tax=Bremerella cremea TaxID=1031537 RepID=A0A368KU20_9BACT|nr:efflux RND transporter periplasmic adaptor subunit [Bremerella cremea]RCS53898.1 efflux RND transporter periplasmic adaptor subunit [Bremerella cremea]